MIISSITEDLLNITNESCFKGLGEGGEKENTLYVDDENCFIYSCALTDHPINTGGSDHNLESETYIRTRLGGGGWGRVIDFYLFILF